MKKFINILSLWGLIILNYQYTIFSASPFVYYSDYPSKHHISPPSIVESMPSDECGPRKLLQLLLDREPIYSKGDEIASKLKETLSPKFIEDAAQKIICMCGKPIGMETLLKTLPSLVKFEAKFARTQAGMSDRVIEDDKTYRMFGSGDQWLRVSPGATLSNPRPSVTKINPLSLETWASQLEVHYAQPGPWSTWIYSMEELDLSSRIPSFMDDVVIAVVRPDHIYATIERLQSLGYVVITNDFPEVIVQTTPIIIDRYKKISPVRDEHISFICDSKSLVHPHPAMLAHATDIAWQRTQLTDSKKTAIVINNRMSVYSNDQMVFYPTIEELNASGITNITLLLDGVYANDKKFPFLHKEQTLLSKVLKGKCGRDKDGRPIPTSFTVSNDIFQATELASYLRSLKKAHIQVSPVCLGDVHFEYEFWRRVDRLHDALKKAKERFDRGEIEIAEALSDYLARQFFIGILLGPKYIEIRKEQIAAFLNAIFQKAIERNDPFILAVLNCMFSACEKIQSRKLLPAGDHDVTSQPVNELVAISELNLKPRDPSQTVLPLFDKEGSVCDKTTFAGGLYSINLPDIYSDIYVNNHHYKFEYKNKKSNYTCRLLEYSGDQWLPVAGISFNFHFTSSSRGCDPEGYRRQTICFHEIDLSGLAHESIEQAATVLQQIFFNAIGNRDFIYLYWDKDIFAGKGKTSLKTMFIKALQLLHITPKGEGLLSGYDEEDGEDTKVYPLLKNQVAVISHLMNLARTGQVSAIKDHITSRLQKSSIGDDENEFLVRKVERVVNCSPQEALYFNFLRSVYMLLCETILLNPHYKSTIMQAFLLLENSERKQVAKYLRRIIKNQDHYNTSFSSELLSLLEKKADILPALPERSL